MTWYNMNYHINGLFWDTLSLSLSIYIYIYDMEGDSLLATLFLNE